MLRVLSISGQVISAVFKGNRAIVEAALLTGLALGLAISSVVHASMPEAFIAAAVQIWAGLRVFEAAEEVGTPIRLKKAAAALMASLAITGAGESQERQQTEEIRDSANAARDSQIEEAESFAARVLELAREHREAAEATGQSRERLDEGMAEVAETFDLGDFDPSDYGLTEQEGPVLYVLVSLGMPDEALRRYAYEANELNATLVIRGFYGTSFGDTQMRIGSLFTQDEAAGIIIDPRPFKAFNVTRVPAIVYSEAPIEPCGEIGCVPAAPPHDIVRGNISLRAALEMFDRS